MEKIRKEWGYDAWTGFPAEARDELTAYFTASKIPIDWPKEISANSIEKTNNALINSKTESNEKKQPIGGRIERLRTIEKWVNEIELDIQKRMEEWNELQKNALPKERQNLATNSAETIRASIL